jgi:hypothetical protein
MAREIFVLKVRYPGVSSWVLVSVLIVFRAVFVGVRAYLFLFLLVLDILGLAVLLRSSWGLSSCLIPFLVVLVLRAVVGVVLLMRRVRRLGGDEMRRLL